MVRAANAPVETMKFMGHGFCDNITKSVSLQNFTCDLTIITQTIFNIKNILKIAPKELRGIGIQISRLDSGQNDIHKTNTLRSMFEKQEKAHSSKEQSNQLIRDKSNVNSDNRMNRSQSLRKIKSFGGTPTSQDKKNSFRPSQKLNRIYEELDLNVLAELPDDIREEVIREQKRVLQTKSETKTDVNLMMAEQQRKIGAKKMLARKLENEFRIDESEGFDDEFESSNQTNEDFKVSVGLIIQYDMINRKQITIIILIVF